MKMSKILLAFSVCLIAFGINAQTNRGTEFWIAVPGNNGSPSPELYITAEANSTVTVDAPGVAFNTVVNVLGGTLEVVTLPSSIQIQTNGVVGGLGINITATTPVTAYLMNAQNATTDAYLALPLDALGTDYYVLGYSPDQSFLIPAQLAVVATEDNTTVTITPTATGGGFTAGVAGNVVLNKGQTFQLRSSVFTPAGDYSGSKVVSDKPIAVFGGNRCTNISGALRACDHLVQQLPPTSAWGQSFVTVPLATRLAGDVFRILAQTNNTEVKINGAVVATLNAGEFHETILGSNTYNRITGDKPILVGQYSRSSDADGVTSDPFFVLVPPDEQFLNNYVVSSGTVNIPTNFLNLTSPTANTTNVKVDGMDVPPASWTVIPGTNFSGAQVPVTTGVHSVSSVLPVGVVAYGFGSFDSYGYLGGQSFGAVATVTTLDVTPTNATVQQNNQQCFSAEVKDQFGDPVSGVRVDAEFIGANSFNTFAFTNASGIATLCYTPANDGLDTGVFTLGGLADTSYITVTQAPIVPPGPPQTDTCHAANVVSFNPGLQKNGQPVNPARLDPNQALGTPENDDTFNFVSLGIGGELILDFGLCQNQDPKIAVGDITIVETSFGGPTCAQYPERADIYGRLDPLDPWTFMGQICLTGTVNTLASGLPAGITQIRIVDATGNNTPSRDGYDVDGIIAVCQCEPVIFDPCECESPDTVVSYMQGTRRDGNPVLANRSDPWEATGMPEDDDTYNFFTLGYGGNIVLGWTGNKGINNNVGLDDLRIVETSFKDPACRRYPETAAIELSLDGITWVAYDTICLDGYVNLDNYGFSSTECVKYIRITDVTKPFGGGATDAYDVDGVECLSGPQKRGSSNKPALVADDFIKVYPNPATSTANIRVEAMEDNSITVRVFNMMGQMVNTFSAYGLIDETMDVSRLSSGLYLIEIDIDGVIMNEKLMVQPVK